MKTGNVKKRKTKPRNWLTLSERADFPSSRTFRRYFEELRSPRKWTQKKQRRRF